MSFLLEFLPEILAFLQKIKKKLISRKSIPIYFLLVIGVIFCYLNSLNSIYYLLSFIIFFILIIFINQEPSTLNKIDPIKITENLIESSFKFDIQYSEFTDKIINTYIPNSDISLRIVFSKNPVVIFLNDKLIKSSIISKKDAFLRGIIYNQYTISDNQKFKISIIMKGYLKPKVILKIMECR